MKNKNLRTKLSLSAIAAVGAALAVGTQADLSTNRTETASNSTQNSCSVVPEAVASGTPSVASLQSSFKPQAWCVQIGWLRLCF